MLLTTEHLNSFMSYVGFDCLYAHHSVSPVPIQQKCLSNKPEGG